MSRDSKKIKIFVDAQLDVEIDGQPGSIQGQGDQLQFVLEREETLERLLAGDSNYAARLADQLSNFGLTLTIIEQQRPLVRMGSKVSSPISSLFTGSKHLAPANFSSLLRLIRKTIGLRRSA